jgi:hypothetical protein
VILLSQIVITIPHASPPAPGQPIRKMKVGKEFFQIFTNQKNGRDLGEGDSL